MLEPGPRPDLSRVRADDPRLGELIEFWTGDESAFTPGRAVLLGFPQDEGVRRNGGRVGAALAPDEIRTWLFRLAPHDCSINPEMKVKPPLDIGNVRVSADLESSQAALGELVAAILQRGAVPIVLGGGHETAYGHYLGYVTAKKAVAIVNIDAHLDVRPLIDGLGHSGSPFRQALEHPEKPLPGNCYVCIGVQPQSVSRNHLAYVRERGCHIHWHSNQRGQTETCFREELNALGASRQIYVSIDADVIRTADVPGVSAPNPAGLDGQEVLACARLAGLNPRVASFDLVEINPRFDRDHQSVRWAALAVWNFLIGLTMRSAANA